MMDQERFVDLAAQCLADLPPIQGARIVETNAEVDVTGQGVVATETYARTIAATRAPTPCPDVQAILRNELRLPRAMMTDILRRSGRLPDFKLNPERFLKLAVPDLPTTLIARSLLNYGVPRMLSFKQSQNIFSNRFLRKARLIFGVI